jgi:hypothetical protein
MSVCHETIRDERTILPKDALYYNRISNGQISNPIGIGVLQEASKIERAAWLRPDFDVLQGFSNFGE